MKRRFTLLGLLLLGLFFGSFSASAQNPPVGSIAGASLGSNVPGIGEAPKVPVYMGAVQVPLPEKVQAQDLPNDDGSGIALVWKKAEGETEELVYVVSIAENRAGPWYEAVRFPANVYFKEDFPANFPGFYWFKKHRERKTWHAAIISGVTKEDGSTIPVKGKTYFVKLAAEYRGATREYPEIFEVTPRENWFHTGRSNNFLFAVIFGAIVLYFIARARRDPNLFIRKIAGLEAVDEAIGRATEMGKPILYINGMDPLSSLSTIASINILGRVARRVASYESQLSVPCRDAVVLSVAQEVVKQGYADAGRPDAYNEDNIFFLTEDQFSYTAAVCGLMMRDKPAANFFMGYYYAESLILAETGASTGAIQIAGTDSATQLPFFVTTCDYTLIGEELYAASAYLAREPMLLGSLKGQDVGKVFIMVIIVLGTLLATLNMAFVKDLFKALG